jgi:hypothetical protein
MALQMDSVPKAETRGGDLPVGFIGVVSPMNASGLAPFSYLGVAYRRGLVLASAAVYQISFGRQQQRMVERLLATPYATVTGGQTRCYDTAAITRAVLRRQFGTGFRVVLGLAGGSETRLIVQQARVPEIRRVLADVVGERFSDES